MSSVWDVLTTALSPLLYRIIAAATIVVVTYFIVRGLERLVVILFRGLERGYVARVVEGLRIGIYAIAALIVATVIAPEIQVLSILVLLIGLSIIAMFFDVLRNIGSEFYIRTRNIVRRGDWIEIEGISIRVVDLDAFGIIGETHKLEKVFIPYSKIVSSLIINRATPLGLVARMFIGIPQSYSMDSARNSVLEAVRAVEQDLASEPNITYIGTKGGVMEFAVEFHIINYRKLSKVISTIEKEIGKRIPEAVVRA
ncbi:MAG: mechanosensitive ion channel family protein [Ignisphaera sp.]|nr:mechanosensitive ion channel family protein [Ignisphaera sp.]MDW8085708.1 mechanosensitive ion channel family protein [Ignisphaera sp.]